MTEEDYLKRFLFLESIAGVPGMVGGMLRHLHSLRTMERDYGWIHTLLEEAENERMHLLTFLELKKPGPAFRGLVLLAQGVFFNLYFISYLLSPRTCHRFVGYLEEEAVKTYSKCINDIETRLPQWREMPATKLSKKYWHLPEDATMEDVIKAVRADEAIHREVNHTLSELKPNEPNPFHH
ncbi:alxA [Symbiodinium sp. KB8]|nr:alxA [Symbiodinium sp. KB8]